MLDMKMKSTLGSIEQLRAERNELTGKIQELSMIFQSLSSNLNDVKFIQVETDEVPT